MNKRKLHCEDNRMMEEVFVEERVLSFLCMIVLIRKTTNGKKTKSVLSKSRREGFQAIGSFLLESV